MSDTLRDVLAALHQCWPDDYREENSVGISSFDGDSWSKDFIAALAARNVVLSDAQPAPALDDLMARRAGKRVLTFDNGRHETYEAVSVWHEPSGGMWDRILIARDDGTLADRIVDALAASQPAPALDVERLAEAMDNAADPEWGLPVDTLEAAQVIADEYARLAASQPVTEYEKGPG